MDLDGAHVLLTGATGGIGHAIARTLADRGAQLVLTGRRADVLEPLAVEVGGRAVATDLADRAAVAKLVEDAGPIDVLVANAALPASGPLDDFTVAEIDRALDVNLRAPMVLARLLTGQMTGQGRGHLVFISSLVGKVATPQASLYAATKYGLRGFALSLRQDLAAQGVGVSTIFPGFIREAGMFADAGVKLPPGVGTSSPDQVAGAVAKAIEKNVGEIDVAPLTVRIGAMFGGVAPGLAAAVQRRFGASAIADATARGQREKR